MEPSGVHESSVSWSPVKGEHLLELSVNPDGRIKESDQQNDACEFRVRVLSKPDLSVSLGNPVKIEKQKIASSSGICLLFLSLLGGRRKKPLFLLLLAVLIILAFSGCIEDSHIAEKTAYTIPVKITNNGEASARNFDVNIYLDGKNATVLNIPELVGKKPIETDIRVEVTDGEHALSAKVDENNHIIESDEDNNAYKTSCNFN
jgi:subtilase family serine protease